MKKLILVFVVFSTTLANVNCQTISRIDTNFKAGHYQMVVDEIDIYLKHHLPTLNLDLMKISSLCLLGKSTSSNEAYDYIIHAYRLSGNDELLINQMKSSCDGQTIENLHNITAATPSASVKLPGISGKLGRTTHQFSLAKAGDTVKIIHPITYAELGARCLMVDTNKTDSAKLFYSRLYDSFKFKNYELNISGSFVITTIGLHISKDEFNSIVAKLNTYYKFYINQYGMQASHNYIQIFLAADAKELNKFSSKVHGFRSPSYSLGYSSFEDNCIASIAYVAGKPLMGSTCHELFHILSHNSFRSLPPWLEEGMASLYEVSEIKSDSTISGSNSWRLQFLAYHHLSVQFKTMRLNELLSKNWQTFNKTDEKHWSNQSLNYAYSRYLMLYLQQMGTLVPFFKEASSYSYMNIVIDPVTDYENIVNKYTTKLQNFDELFKAWVYKQYLANKYLTD
ncbi:hypothetical protein ACFGVS_18405 [Mucilaginibacter sp. AW1-7]|uniref:hypothetical protein n=1 Tax=Mucilaginibacter sp. AW1-7 TaxID=3349874 RepID=UPI003F734F29